MTAEINPAWHSNPAPVRAYFGNQQDLTNVINVLRKNADVEYYIVGQAQ